MQDLMRSKQWSLCRPPAALIIGLRKSNSDVSFRREIAEMKEHTHQDEVDVLNLTVEVLQGEGRARTELLTAKGALAAECAERRPRHEVGRGHLLGRIRSVIALQSRDKKPAWKLPTPIAETRASILSGSSRNPATLLMPLLLEAPALKMLAEEEVVEREELVEAMEDEEPLRGV